MKRILDPRVRRHIRVRRKVSGTPERPRISVFRSLKHIYAQAIDDLNRVTVASASSKIGELPSVEGEYSGKKKAAKAVGKQIAMRLKELGISKAVFDRGGYIYHGRVAAVAEGVREGGIEV